MVHTASKYTDVPSEKNKPGYEQLYSFDFTEAIGERLETQSNYVCMTEIMQRLAEMMLQLSPT
jgi:hypothetical protein